MGLAAFIVCGVAAFYAHRTAHGRTAEEQAAYEIGEKAGLMPSGRPELPVSRHRHTITNKDGNRRARSDSCSD
jgi:hypothetical protein